MEMRQNPYVTIEWWVFTTCGISLNWMAPYPLAFLDVFIFFKSIFVQLNLSMDNDNPQFIQDASTFSLQNLCSTWRGHISGHSLRLGKAWPCWLSSWGIWKSWQHHGMRREVASTEESPLTGRVMMDHWMLMDSSWLSQLLDKPRDCEISP